jgi:hypothetical protein
MVSPLTEFGPQFAELILQFYDCRGVIMAKRVQFPMKRRQRLALIRPAMFCPEPFAGPV